MKSIIELLIEKRRITQWLIVTCGTVVCVTGGYGGWLSEDRIIQAFLGMMTAVLGVEVSKKG